MFCNHYYEKYENLLTEDYSDSDEIIEYYSKDGDIVTYYTFYSNYLSKTITNPINYQRLAYYTRNTNKSINKYYDEVNFDDFIKSTKNKLDLVKNSNSIFFSPLKSKEFNNNLSSIIKHYCATSINYTALFRATNYYHRVVLVFLCVYISIY